MRDRPPTAPHRRHGGVQTPAHGVRLTLEEGAVKSPAIRAFHGAPGQREAAADRTVREGRVTLRGQRRWARWTIAIPKLKTRNESEP